MWANGRHDAPRFQRAAARSSIDRSWDVQGGASSTGDWWTARRRRIYSVASQAARDPLEVHVVQRDVWHPGRIAVGILLRHQPADVDAVGELDAQLEGSESEVHAEHVIRGSVRPGVGERRVQLRPAPSGVVEDGVVRIDHAAEIESDYAGQAAEEGEADQHVEGELELRLADVVAVAEQAGIAPAEPAQVVEAREIEASPEPAALRRAGSEAQVQLAPAHHPEGVDRVRLQVCVEAGEAGRGNVAAAQLDQQRGAADRSARSVAGGIPAIAEAHFALRI